VERSSTGFVTRKPPANLVAPPPDQDDAPKNRIDFPEPQMAPPPLPLAQRPPKAHDRGQAADHGIEALAERYERIHSLVTADSLKAGLFEDSEEENNQAPQNEPHEQEEDNQTPKIQPQEGQDNQAPKTQPQEGEDDQATNSQPQEEEEEEEVPKPELLLTQAPRAKVSSFRYDYLGDEEEIAKLAGASAMHDGYQPIRGADDDDDDLTNSGDQQPGDRPATREDSVELKLSGEALVKGPSIGYDSLAAIRRPLARPASIIKLGNSDEEEDLPQRPLVSYSANRDQEEAARTEFEEENGDGSREQEAVVKMRVSDEEEDLGPVSIRTSSGREVDVTPDIHEESEVDEDLTGLAGSQREENAAEAKLQVGLASIVMSSDNETSEGQKTEEDTAEVISPKSKGNGGCGDDDDISALAANANEEETADLGYQMSEQATMSSGSDTPAIEVEASPPQSSIGPEEEDELPLKGAARDSNV
jgi:hypothetical protein